jgi:hypothetical protein
MMERMIYKGSARPTARIELEKNKAEDELNFTKNDCIKYLSTDVVSFD